VTHFAERRLAPRRAEWARRSPRPFPKRRQPGLWLALSRAFPSGVGAQPRRCATSPRWGEMWPHLKGSYAR